MEYLLRKSVIPWLKEEPVIITAFTDNNSLFYCWNVNVLSNIESLIPGIQFASKDLLIAQLAMPSFYTKIPFYITPMYHEVGHFIDGIHGISLNALYNTSFNQSLIISLNLPYEFYSLDQQTQNFLLERHLSEYFCDLFAAMFIGDSICKFLNYVAGDAVDTLTHPATHKRIANIDSFLSGSITPIAQEFNKILKGLSLPEIAIRHSAPDISKALKNIETYSILNDQEAHGIILSYWNALDSQFSKNDHSIFSLNFSMSNDLIVKSIRNYSIREKWNK